MLFGHGDTCPKIGRRRGNERRKSAVIGLSKLALPNETNSFCKYFWIPRVIISRCAQKFCVFRHKWISAVSEKYFELGCCRGLEGLLRLGRLRQSELNGVI